MKTTTVTAALAVLAIAGSAHAYMFKPKHQTFTLSGQVLLFNDLTCSLSITGTTHGERAVITSAVLSGGSCSNLVAQGIP